MYIGLHFKQTNQKGSRVNNTLPTTVASSTNHYFTYSYTLDLQ